MSNSGKELSALPKRVLITGASGYIGNQVAARLVNLGLQVHVLTRPNSDLRGLSGVTRHDIPTSHQDSHNITTIAASVAPDAIIHLASLVKGNHTQDNCAEFVAAHITLPTQLLESAPPIFINTGSYWELGDAAPGPWRHRPNSLYAATKHAINPIIDYYVGRGNTRATTLMLYDVYGPRDWRGKLVSLLAQRARSQDATPIHLSPGDQLLYYVHIDDVVESYITTLRTLWFHHTNASPVIHDTRAVRCESPCSLRELVQTAERVWNTKLRCTFTAPYPANQIMVPNTEPSLPTGWNANITLSNGLRTLLEV